MRTQMPSSDEVIKQVDAICKQRNIALEEKIGVHTVVAFYMRHYLSYELMKQKVISRVSKGTERVVGETIPNFLPSINDYIEHISEDLKIRISMQQHRAILEILKKLITDVVSDNSYNGKN